MWLTERECWGNPLKIPCKQKIRIYLQIGVEMNFISTHTLVVYSLRYESKKIHKSSLTFLDFLEQMLLFINKFLRLVWKKPLFWNNLFLYVCNFFLCKKLFWFVNICIVWIFYIFSISKIQLLVFLVWFIFINFIFQRHLCVYFIFNSLVFHFFLFFQKCEINFIFISFFLVSQNIYFFSIYLFVLHLRIDCNFFFEFAWITERRLNVKRLKAEVIFIRCNRTSETRKGSVQKNLSMRAAIYFYTTQFQSEWVFHIHKCNMQEHKFKQRANHHSRGERLKEKHKQTEMNNFSVSMPHIPVVVKHY